MAARGTSKRLSVEQEEHVARQYDGKRSKSSGGAAHDYGDVRTETELIECKYTDKPPKKLLDDFEKIAKEAWEAIPASIGYNRIGAAYGRLGQDMASFVEERALALLARPAEVAREDAPRRRAETP